MLPNRSTDDVGALVAMVGDRTDSSVTGGVAEEAVCLDAIVWNLAAGGALGDGHGDAHHPEEAGATVRMIGMALGPSEAAEKLRRGSKRNGTISG